MHFSDHGHRASGAARVFEERQQVPGHVGVRAEAQAQLAVVHAARHQLRHHVHPVRQDLARDMRVIGAQVVALRVYRTEERARRQEELDHAYVAGHGAVMYRARVVRLDVAAEHALDERTGEARLERCASPRLQQRQRGDDGEIDRRVAQRAPVKLVGERVGLADAERHRQHDARSDALQHRVDAVTDVSEYLRQFATLRLDQPESLAPGGGREARVEADNLEGGWIVISGDQCGRQLQTVCGPQRMHAQ